MFQFYKILRGKLGVFSVHPKTAIKTLDYTSVPRNANPSPVQILQYCRFTLCINFLLLL